MSIKHEQEIKDLQKRLDEVERVLAETAETVRTMAKSPKEKRTNA